MDTNLQKLFLKVAESCLKMGERLQKGGRVSKLLKKEEGVNHDWFSPFVF